MTRTALRLKSRGWILICSLPTSRPNHSSHPTFGITRLRPRRQSRMVCTPTRGMGMVREGIPRNLRSALGRHHETTSEEWARTWSVSLGLPVRPNHQTALPLCPSQPSTTLRTPRTWLPACQPMAYRTHTHTRTLNTPTPNSSRTRTRCSSLSINSGGLQGPITTPLRPKAHRQHRIIPCRRRSLLLHNSLCSTAHSPLRTCPPHRLNRKPIQFEVHRSPINTYRHHRHHHKSHHIFCPHPTTINCLRPWNRGRCWNQWNGCASRPFWIPVSRNRRPAREAASSPLLMRTDPSSRSIWRHLAPR